MIPWDAPIFMLPLAGMMFLLGAFTHHMAGVFWKDGDDFFLWLGAFCAGMALQIGAVVILISA